MVVTVRSLGLTGIRGYEVTVECFLSGGLPAFDMVGLPDAAVKERFVLGKRRLSGIRAGSSESDKNAADPYPWRLS